MDSSGWDGSAAWPVKISTLTQVKRIQNTFSASLTGYWDKFALLDCLVDRGGGHVWYILNYPITLNWSWVALHRHWSSLIIIYWLTYRILGNLCVANFLRNDSSRRFCEKKFANCLVHNGPHPHCEISRKKILRFARICEIRKNLATRKFPDIRYLQCTYVYATTCIYCMNGHFVLVLWQHTSMLTVQVSLYPDWLCIASVSWILFSVNSLVDKPDCSSYYGATQMN